MVSSLQAIAEYVSQFNIADLSEEELSHLKLLIMDALGCGIFGSTLPWSRIVSEFVASWDTTQESTIWGTKFRSHCSNSVLANSIAVHGFEFDDVHMPLGLHTGCSVVTSALAVAEFIGSSGEDAICAIAMGMETMIRIRQAMDMSHVKNGWNSTGTTSPFGSSVAAGLLMGLDDVKIAHAMAVAGMHSGGLQASQFSMSKRYIAARPAQGGVLSAFLAARGFEGSLGLLESETGGFLKAFSDQADPKRIVDGLGTKRGLLDIGIKPYPAARSVHVPVELAIELQRAHSIDPKAISKVLVRVHPISYYYQKQLGLGNLSEMLFSIPYGVACALLDGVFTVDQMVESRLRSATLLDILSRVEIREDAQMERAGPIARWGATVEIQLRSGESFSLGPVLYPLGTRERPLSKHDVESKFDDLVIRVMGEERASEIRRSIDDLQSLSDVRGLCTQLAP